MGAIGKAADDLAGNRHTHGGCAGDNHRAHEAAGRQHDEEPFAAPEVGGLGNRRAEYDG